MLEENEKKVVRVLVLGDDNSVGRKILRQLALQHIVAVATATAADPECIDSSKVDLFSEQEFRLLPKDRMYIDKSMTDVTEPLWLQRQKNKKLHRRRK